jgi:hypothetical protein
MRRSDIHHLVVMDASQILGILSDRDAGSRRGASVRAGHTVADLMTTHVVTRSPTDTIRSAANLMRGRTIGCLPIVKRPRLVGIVTVSDLLVLEPPRTGASHTVNAATQSHPGKGCLTASRECSSAYLPVVLNGQLLVDSRPQYPRRHAAVQGVIAFGCSAMLWSGLNSRPCRPRSRSEPSPPIIVGYPDPRRSGASCADLANGHTYAHGVRTTMRSSCSRTVPDEIAPTGSSEVSKGAHPLCSA